MNRPIKFRAWSKLDRTMSPSATFAQWCYQSYARELDALSDSNIELMQFTGLTDKNGKDVFEGDIVRCTSGCPHTVEWRAEIGGEFGGGMPGWYLSELRTGFGKGYAWMGSEEVIGNVYESPELIEREVEEAFREFRGDNKEEV